MNMSKITVYYDGKCALCSKEIRYYQKIAPRNIFDWQDITVSEQGLLKEGVSLTEGLNMLHVKDINGQMHIGLDAFIIIWKQLRKWRILAALVELPIIRQFANVIYRAFANWRYKRLEHCKLG